MTKNIYTTFEDRTEFINFLKQNKNVIVIKVGASWCNPCKKIHNQVHQFFQSLPDSVICVDFDVDENDDVYAMLSKFGIASSLPTLLCYKEGDTFQAPSYSVVGTQELQNFYDNVRRVMKK